MPEGLAIAERLWLLRTQMPTAQRLQAGLLLLHFRYRSGALWALVDAGEEVLPLLREQAVPAAQLIDTLRMVTLGAADAGRFEVAMNLGYEAHRLAVENGDGARLSLATNMLGCVYERIGDPWHAERLLLDALQQGQDAGDSHAVYVALNNLVAMLIGVAYLMWGSAPDEEVEQTLLRALPHADQALQSARKLAEPFLLAFVLGNRGELLALLGRLDEAHAGLAEATEISARHGFEAVGWRIACSMGEYHLRRGDAGQAMAVLQQALQESAVAGARMTRLRLHHAAWRAARALGQTGVALEQLEQYERLERARMLIQLRGHSQLFVTTVEAEQVRLEARRAGERAALAEVSARVDELTGLGNRRELEQHWPLLAQRLQTRQRPLALAMLDIDHFKQVNDRFGHAVGDRVLVVMAALLRENMRGDDLIIRTGGEEFLLLLPDVDREGAEQICDRTRQRVAAYDWTAVAAGLAVTVSVGVAGAPPYERQALEARADRALYEAKHGGRNAVRCG